MEGHCQVRRRWQQLPVLADQDYEFKERVS